MELLFKKYTRQEFIKNKIIKNKSGKGYWTSFEYSLDPLSSYPMSKENHPQNYFTGSDGMATSSQLCSPSLWEAKMQTQRWGLGPYLVPCLRKSLFVLENGTVSVIILLPHSMPCSPLPLAKSKRQKGAPLPSVRPLWPMLT